MHRKHISSWTQSSPRFLSTHWQHAVEFSYSLPSFPILLLFNKAGHCSGNLWLQLSGYLCRQTGKWNSCSQRAAECSDTKAGEEKKKKKEVESEKVSCSGTETQVGENHSPPVFIHVTLGGIPKCCTNKESGFSSSITRTQHCWRRKTELHYIYGRTV